MSRTVLALVLLVAITAALQLGTALRTAEMPNFACGPCHDGAVMPLSPPASSSATR
jgi:hypothetical protein